MDTSSTKKNLLARNQLADYSWMGDKKARSELSHARIASRSCYPFRKIREGRTKRVQLVALYQPYVVASITRERNHTASPLANLSHYLQIACMLLVLVVQYD